MPSECTTRRERRTTERTDRIKRRRERQERQCEELPWWDPRRWICTLVTIISYYWETVVTVVEEWVEWTECTIADFSRSVGRILGGILRAIVRAITAIVEGIASILLAIAATIAAVVGAVIDLINNVFSRRFTIFQSHTGRPIPSVPRLTAHGQSGGRSFQPSRKNSRHG